MKMKGDDWMLILAIAVIVILAFNGAVRNHEIRQAYALEVSQ